MQSMTQGNSANFKAESRLIPYSTRIEESSKLRNSEMNRRHDKETHSAQP